MKQSNNNTFVDIVYSISDVGNDRGDLIGRHNHYFSFISTEYVIGYITDRPIAVEYILEFVR